MESLTEFAIVFVAVCSGITTVIVCASNIYSKIKQAKKPHDDHVAQVKEHEEKLNNDYVVLEELKAEMRILLTNDILVMNHIIEGNHVDKLKEQRDFLHRYLIER